MKRLIFRLYQGVAYKLERLCFRFDLPDRWYFFFREHRERGERLLYPRQDTPADYSNVPGGFVVPPEFVEELMKAQIMVGPRRIIPMPRVEGQVGPITVGSVDEDDWWQDLDPDLDYHKPPQTVQIDVDGKPIKYFHVPLNEFLNREYMDNLADYLKKPPKNEGAAEDEEPLS